MWSIDPIQIQALAYIQTNICRTCFQKWNCHRRVREEEKKKRMMVDNNEIYHICVGTKHN
jgi:hypothetical protein